MKDIVCKKCKKVAEIEADDMWQFDLEDCMDDTMVYRYTGYCENEIIDEEDPDGNWEYCGATIEIVRYARLQDHMDIEQEEDE
tara:strand:- start:408 stop:656 length:249 start_codon:yes stop_codon:yes gene_type:complete